jgi:uncharacterized membrane protein HdeD (DUF308 family)
MASAPMKAARRVSGWYVAAAILFIVLGFFAILEPAIAGLGVALLVGWLLLFGGVAHLVSSFEGGGPRRVLVHVLAAIAFVLGGVYLLMNPLLTLDSLTLLLAAIIIVAGVCEILAYLRHRSAPGAPWLLVNGIIALLLGGLIGLHWPSSSVWAIGTLVGVNLLLSGFARLMLALAARRLMAS